jgi:hypothetical protein
MLGRAQWQVNVAKMVGPSRRFSNLESALSPSCPLVYGPRAPEGDEVISSLVSVAESVQIRFCGDRFCLIRLTDVVLEAAVNGRADLLVMFNQADFAAAAKLLRSRAESEGIFLNQLIHLGVAEKISALHTEEFFGERGARANVKKARKILMRAGKEAPREGDEIF